jgi:N-acetylglucosamine-6-phosphate deacetylase
VAPGFIDLHVHGGGGAALWSGEPEESRRACAFHARHGTTGLLATTLPAAPEDLREAVRGIAAAREHEPALLGIHLEGPFLSPDRPGALDPRRMRLPDRGELAELLAAAGGAIRIMTLAPELPGGLDLIADLAGAGVVPALGHSAATYEVARAAIAAGARHATHLFNASGPLHHREPGVAGAALDAPEVTCELIADGHHLHAATLRLAHRVKGAAGLALITDAIPAAGAPDGESRLGDAPIVVAGGVARTAAGALAGSTLTMAGAVRHAVHAAGIPLPDALAMASATPARVLGLEGRKGVLASGADADLVVLDDDLGVHATYRAGRLVHAREEIPAWS